MFQDDDNSVLDSNKRTGAPRRPLFGREGARHKSVLKKRYKCGVKQKRRMGWTLFSRHAPVRARMGVIAATLCFWATAAGSATRVLDASPLDSAAAGFKSYVLERI